MTMWTRAAGKNERQEVTYQESCLAPTELRIRFLRRFLKQERTVRPASPAMQEARLAIDR